jgi:hypothetical protein
MPRSRFIRILALAVTSAICLAGAAFAASGLTPSTWDVIFDDVQVGSTSAPQQVTLTNNDHGPVRIGQSSILGPHPRDFLLSSDACSNTRLDGGETCKLAVRFRPTVKGTRVAHLRIPNDGSGCAVWIVLAGSGPNREPSARAAACDDDVPPATQQGSTSNTSRSGGDSSTTSTTLANSALRLPAGASARACTSRRAFKIRINPPRGVRFTKVTVRLNNRLISVRRGKRVTAAVNLRGLPRGRFTLRVVATTARGRHISRTRHYVTCVKSKS